MYKTASLSVLMYLFKSDSYAPVNSIGGTDRIVSAPDRQTSPARLSAATKRILFTGQFMPASAAETQVYMRCRQKLCREQGCSVSWARTAWAEGPVDSVHVAISVGMGRRPQHGPLRDAHSRRDHITYTITYGTDVPVLPGPFPKIVWHLTFDVLFARKFWILTS